MITDIKCCVILLKSVSIHYVPYDGPQHLIEFLYERRQFSIMKTCLCNIQRLFSAVKMKISSDFFLNNFTLNIDCGNRLERPRIARMSFPDA